MFTKDAYLEFMRVSERETLIAHRRYFSQFVTNEIRETVLSTFGLPALKNAYQRDKHLNTIHVDKWHSLIISNRSLLDNNLLKEAGETFCLTNATHIFKEAARQVIE